ncbi:ABC transporter ATP-binding protein [Reichenbachiella sp.]
MRFIWSAYESISKDMLRSIYKKGYSYFNENNSNKILNRIITVPQNFSQSLLVQIILFISEFLMLVLIITSLALYDYKILITLALIVIPVFLLFYNLTKKRIAYYFARLNALSPLVRKPVFEIVFGYVDVVIGNVFNSFENAYQDKIRESKKIKIILNTIQSIPNRLVEICVILAVLTILIYGLYYLQDPEKIIAMLSVFALAAYRALPSINRLMLALMNVKGQMFNLKIMEEFLPHNESNKVVQLGDFQNSIKINQLSFQFPNSEFPLLKEINLVVKKGESIGIVGKSGSGKTTLINILLGFVDNYNGNIEIDGVKLEQHNLASWQNKIGYVRQDVFLIDGSIRDNVAFGIPADKVDENRLKKSLEKAQLLEFVENLPEKFDTLIGERGSKISGGQRQRIGIARALYHEAKVLLFDEATSALDDETETEITEAIRSLQNENLTMIIVAHRKSTLKYCDRIIKIEKGEIKPFDNALQNK